MHRKITQTAGVIAAGLVLVLGVGVGVVAAQDAASTTTEAAPTEPMPDGETLFMTKTCFTCHGADAKTPLLPEFPRLAGQNEAYMLQQIKDIKSGARNNGMTAAMKGILHLVNEEEMEIIVKYIASLDP